MERTHGGNFGGVFLFAFLGGALMLMLMAQAATIPDTMPDPKINLPPVPAQPSQHAVERHVEATEIHARYGRGDYLCMRAYRSLAVGRILFLFDYSDTSLQAGIITTVSGSSITAFTSTRAYWAGVIARDQYVFWTYTGRC